ncbi:MAG: hypothetical protein JO038_07215 [Alphaproteobacteria bacterium]|nr:hypothetical protein [Alphaproteobacteria bacterium]
MPRDLSLVTAFDHVPDPPSPVRQQRRRSTPGADGQGTGRGLPVIKIGGGSLPLTIDDAERALLATDHDLYQRGDYIVRPAAVAIRIADQRSATALRLVVVKANHLVERFTAAADFQRFDARSRKWVSVDCPPSIAAAYLERVGLWRLRVLTGIANAPTLRPDGTVLDQPGYDTATGILFDPRGIAFPPVPLRPTRADALAALAKLRLLTSEFPFIADREGSDASASRSVALSGILTACIRRSLPAAPLHAFTAPVMGSGKSKLVDLASMIASGHEAPVISQGATPEEMEKRLGAALIAGDALVSLDNVEHAIGGELLCQAVTQAELRIRILGKSLNVPVPNTAAFFATGNNLQIDGDMVRRAIICSLDPQCERPENRTFATEDPVETVRRDRAEYLVAALTVLRAYDLAGRPQQTSPLGSFEAWSRWVRDALVWLGESDPCATMERARENDHRLQTLAAVLHEWHAALGSAAVTTKQVIDKATDRYALAGAADLNERGFLHPEFREALLVVAGDGGAINSKRLGHWISRHKGRIVNDLRIVEATVSHGNARWAVVTAS